MSTVDGPERRLRYLQAMGIDIWERRECRGAAPVVPASGGAVPSDAGPVQSGSTGVAPRGAPEGASGPSVSVTPVGELPWSELGARVAGCTGCGLHQTRTQTVFGVGHPEASWMVIGEAPGADEDRQGEPFVGRAGKLLDEMLKACGLGRNRVYIANILKCRPPRNRDPQPEEVACCEPFLHRQIALVRPRLILAVGRIAAQNLLKTDVPIGRLRGRVHRFGEPAIPVVVTYHPAYLLRSPREKRRVWDDLCLALDI